MYIKNNDFISQVIQGEAVLLNSKSGDYFGLNQVGTDFYNLIDGKRSFDEILKILDEDYNVSIEVLKKDVEELLTKLIEKNIVYNKE